MFSDHPSRTAASVLSSASQAAAVVAPVKLVACAVNMKTRHALCLYVYCILLCVLWIEVWDGVFVNLHLSCLSTIFTASFPFSFYPDQLGVKE